MKTQHNTSTLTEVDSLKLQLSGLLPMKLEDEKRLQEKYMLEFNYNSNHLEGNTLTYGQTELLLLLKVSGDALENDVEEMKAHNVAFDNILQLAKDKERSITEQFVKDLNELILVRSYWKDAITSGGKPTRKKISVGSYKTTPNSVRLRNGEIHEYASPEETVALMGELIQWYKDNINNMHPVQLAAELHYRFVCIHPFDDGNGRVARLLMNYVLAYHDYPPVVIKSKNKREYLTALQKADRGELEAIIEYVEKQMIWSLNLSIRAANSESLRETGDTEKEIELLKREKLTKGVVYKTPKIAYDLVCYYERDIWKEIEVEVERFDDFFSETRKEVFIDDMKVEKIKTKSSFRALFGKDESEVVIKPHEIFHHDFDEHDEKEVKWQWLLLGMKSATKKIDIGIEMRIQFNDTSYTLTFERTKIHNTYNSVKEETIYEQKRKYTSYLMNGELEEILSDISKSLIETIKKEE